MKEVKPTTPWCWFTGLKPNKQWEDGKIIYRLLDGRIYKTIGGNTCLLYKREVPESIIRLAEAAYKEEREEKG